MGSLLPGRLRLPMALSLGSLGWVSVARAQVPGPVPAAPAGSSSDSTPPASAATPAPMATTSPPPLDPPPPPEPPRRPSFLRTADELPPDRASRRGPESPSSSSGELGADERSPAPKAAPQDLALHTSPWLDLTFTSFWMSERVGNFLTVGAQFGGYFFDRLRLSGRLVVPLGEVEDGYSEYDSYLSVPNSNGAYRAVDSSKVSALYTASVGVILASTKSFVFAPGFVVARTDVNDYGTMVALMLPFEWTSRRDIRTGFEFAVGRASGGSVQRVCFAAAATPCGRDELDRPGGTAFSLQFNLGWALGRL